VGVAGIGVTVVVAVAVAETVPIGGPVTEGDGVEHRPAVLHAWMT
jgi:hypothetical protein